MARSGGALKRRNFLFGAAGLFLTGLSAEKTKEKGLQERIIPSSGEKIPVIGIGTWQTFDVSEKSSSFSELEKLLALFQEKGGKLIDSSPMYGNSEKISGILGKKLGREKFIYATKVWTSGESSGKNQIRESFHRFQAEKIEIFQIHNLLDWKTHIKTLRELKESGKIKYIGITHYVRSAFPEMEKIMKSEKIDFIQIPYSVQEREAEKRILPLSEEKGIAVLVNRPFEGGDLFRRFKGKSVPEFAKDFQSDSIAGLLLKFILHRKEVTCIIPATSKTSHLSENMQAGAGRIPDRSEAEKILQFFSEN
ncbi:MAG TPA: aldo/keto reductase [Leptospiraceae bacterium]|nr:aldo/keto reductase [Leptospiraceae bacterium]HNF14256.1 aldo/keto reductase [Leptospiraceae bacterium]HNF24464.1 aldo/keto reductase [Leptospiraceae bacterium]HNM04913.1 aldo/keto reductase [Leptospiraceae bacterium]HNN04275.1 aldo/keto reductase [Leptospiraceae bacterium]